MNLIPKNITSSIPLAILALLMFVFLDISCCKKPIEPQNNTPQEDSLPPITTKGLNTCGYKANGKIVQFKNGWGNYLTFDYDIKEGRLNVECKRQPHFLTFKIDSVFKTGVYSFKPYKIGVKRTGHSAVYRNSALNNFVYGDIVGGKLEVLKLNIDTFKPEIIISGTYDLFIERDDSFDEKDTLEITEGRFDIVKP